jgi:hypothetical protein
MLGLTTPKGARGRKSGEGGAANGNKQQKDYLKRAFSKNNNIRINTLWSLKKTCSNGSNAGKIFRKA